jgi:hypothetical protein
MLTPDQKKAVRLMISIENSTPAQMQAIGESDEHALTALGSFIGYRRQLIDQTLLPQNAEQQTTTQGEIAVLTSRLQDLQEEATRINEELATWDLI